MQDNSNNSTVMRAEGESILFRGADLAGLMSGTTFSQTFYLASTGRTPDAKTSQMIDAILAALMAETAVSPSTGCLRAVAEAGATINTSVAAAIAAMDRKHGLQIEESMKLLVAAIRDMHEINLGVDDQAEITVQHAHNSGAELQGYGKQFNSVDARVAKLLARAEELGFAGNYVKLAQSIEKAYKTVFTMDMPLNVEGLAAALLIEIGVPPEAGPAFFVMAKLPCLTANFIEVKGKVTR